MNTRTLTPLRRGWVATVLTVAVLVSVACVAVIIYYITKEVSEGIFIPSHFFSYFTVHMGLLFAATYVAYAALRPWQTHRSPRRQKWLKLVEVLRFCITVYGVIILPVFWLILSTPPNWNFNDGWVVIHLVMPIVAITAWVSLPHTARIAWWWMFVPLVYLVPFALWSFVHGALATDHWFPYFFLDFVSSGWAFAGTYTGVLFGAVLIVGALTWVCSQSHQTSSSR